MRARPILMSGPLVREILAGRKTMTRRPVKDTWKPGIERIWMAAVTARAESVCPYGMPGDRLWVRETFCEMIPEHYEIPGRPRDELSDRYGEPRRNGIAYRAGCLARRGDTFEDREDEDSKRCRLELGYPRWTPGIHMPRWACRLVLEVTSVRVERLHEITEEDAKAEGVGSLLAFAGKWAEIYGEESWRANPWVWVIGFKRIDEQQQRASGER